MSSNFAIVMTIKITGPLKITVLLEFKFPVKYMSS
jgi:hypothetical protein